MSERVFRRERFERGVDLVVAVLVVTGASYLWRLPQAGSPGVVLAVYLLSASMLLAYAFVIFGRIVPRAYEHSSQMSSLSFFLQIVIWGMFFAFPCIYIPFDWAWSSPHGSESAPALLVVGWACVGLGLVALVIPMVWLGWPRSSGQGSKTLETSGPYRLSRNPQLMAGALLITGYVLLWPSWYAAGWMVVYVAMAHMMVLAEERYLRALHGEVYEEYCRRVARYWEPRRR